ncbi:uncharacterized protein LOC116841815 [Odontomachus brunneus]|uniref:uncharacterized protein LOC116841815 n=1 Tax=Odontomachus brunneus TaxID=486640 RepID=UPI0013F23E0A|nr:uncharacterized protein LOC116841815 [Odontomachus brunneus]
MTAIMQSQCYRFASNAGKYTVLHRTSPFGEKTQETWFADRAAISNFPEPSTLCFEEADDDVSLFRTPRSHGTFRFSSGERVPIVHSVRAVIRGGHGGTKRPRAP